MYQALVVLQPVAKALLVGQIKWRVCFVVVLQG